jgi:hypothetical protein
LRSDSLRRRRPKDTDFRPLFAKPDGNAGRRARVSVIGA